MRVSVSLGRLGLLHIKIKAMGNSSDELTKILAADTARWAEAAEAGNIRIEQQRWFQNAGA